MFSFADAEYNFDPGNPYGGVMSGLFNDIPLIADTGGEGIALSCVSEGLQPWTSAVIILTPDIFYLSM